MVILGEAAPGMEDNEFGTSYVDFYSSMIKVPFLGSYFNTIMPVFILLFGSIFAVFSLFKLKSKTLTAIKQFTKKNLTEDGAAEKAKEEGKAIVGGGATAEKKEEKKVEVSEEQQSIVQRILKGERAILMELDILKKREERNKLLRYNEFSAVDALKGQKSVIEMATKTNGTASNFDETAPARPIRPIDAILAKAKA